MSGAEARADIVYSGLINNGGVPLNDNAGLYVDVGNGLVVTDTPPAGYDLNFFEAATGDPLLQLRLPQAKPSDGAIGSLAGAYAYISKLSLGATIGGQGNTFVTYGIMGAIDSNGTHGSWVGAVNGYVGFRFTLPNDPNTVLYGWARLNVSGDLNSNPSAVLLDYAYDNTGAPILAGAVPEPGSLALGCLAAGAAGLLIWRKRREANAEL